MNSGKYFFNIQSSTWWVQYWSFEGKRGKLKNKRRIFIAWENVVDIYGQSTAGVNSNPYNFPTHFLSHQKYASNVNIFTG